MPILSANRVAPGNHHTRCNTCHYLKLGGDKHAPPPPPAAVLAPPPHLAIQALLPPMPPAPPAAAASHSSFPPACVLDTPLLDLSLSPAQCFERFGYALIRSDPEAITVAAGLSALAHASPPADIAREIAGQLQQFPLDEIPAFAASGLPQQLHSVSMHLAASIGADVSSMYPANIAPSLLVAQPGLGLQGIHCDDYNAWTPDEDLRRLTVVLYCGDSRSTAMPRFSRADFRPNMESSDSKKEFGHFLSPRWFHTVPVKAGDVLIFRQCVPHYGPKNVAKQPRMGCFSMLSPTKEEEQDDVQLYRHHYVSEAYGDDSLQYADALVHDAPFRTMSDTASPATMARLMALLSQHGRLDAYIRAATPRDRKLAQQEKKNAGLATKKRRTSCPMRRGWVGLTEMQQACCDLLEL